MGVIVCIQDGWLKEDVKAPNPVAVKKAVKALLAPPPPVEALEPPKVCHEFSSVL